MPHALTRRDWMLLGAATSSTLTGLTASRLSADERRAARQSLRIAAVAVTPIALPDPPLLAASGCHGPYFLRNIVTLQTEEGIVGVGETHGGEQVTRILQRVASQLVGRSAAAYRGFPRLVPHMGTSAYAGIETACLDALGQATGLRVCELLGGPVREEVEFAAYLFFRYAADHRCVLEDAALVDARGSGAQALDDWGEVLTPERMGEMAVRFRERWGFRVFKLKGGVLAPEAEIETM